MSESLTSVSFHQRSMLLQLYSSSQEDTEVRIAAYQQLMLCPDQEVFEVVKTTLRSETSSQGLLSTFVVQMSKICCRVRGTTVLDRALKNE